MFISIQNYKLLFIVIILVSIGRFSICQEKDGSEVEVIDTTSSAYIRKKVNAEVDMALKRSLLPGLSQIKNKKYWKVPLYYSGFTALGINTFLHHNKLKDYQSLYKNEFNNLRPHSFIGITEDRKEVFQDYTNQMQKHRVIRNLSIGGIGLLYMINLAEGIKPIHKEYHSPYKAGLYSALIPGLGQIYNKEYWKAPLVYIGMGIFAYYINYTNVEYKKYLQAYLIMQDDIALAYANDYLDKNWDSFKDRTIWDDANFTRGKIHKLEIYQRASVKAKADVIKTFKDRWKRYRDLNIIGISAFYLVNIIDATVFAHLHNYDVSDDLTFDFSPKVYDLSAGKIGYGFNLTMKF